MIYLEALDAYRGQRHEQFDRGDFTPFRIPTDIGAYLLIACYLVTSRRRALSSRIGIFILVCLRAFLSIKNSRAAGPAISYLVGIANAWFILVAINMLFILDPMHLLARKTQLSEDGQNKVDMRLLKGHAASTKAWEKMPDSLSKRVFWVMDLLGSTRLIHWSTHYTSFSRRIVQVPQPVYTSGDLSLQRVSLRLLLIFLCAEILKEIVALDPYFWGHNVDLETSTLMRRAHDHGFLLRAYRQLVGVLLVILALRILTTYGHLLFVCILGPSIAGIWGEPWSWRPLHGSLESIWTHGLIGFWGDVWHQMFRIMLTMPTARLIEVCRLEPRGTSARLISLMLPFSISGIIHACGSYTLSDVTDPVQPLIFFTLQPLGILLQLVLAQLITCILPDVIASHGRCFVNVAFTLFWLMLTFPYFVDDVAQGGLFLAEPFPLGALYLLGTGSERKWGNLWASAGIQWYAGKSWWECSLAVG